MTAVAIIPARGGSRRIPRKNIRMFHGKPIIAYSIEAAKKSGLFDIVYVSTDDHDIAEVAIDCGAMHIGRSEEMARDEVGTQEVMRDALLTLNSRIDYACCIYPCAPMLKTVDLWYGHQALVSSEGEYPFVYVDGWFYWGTFHTFTDQFNLDWGLYFQGPPHRWIDINTEEDWQRAERMYEELHR